MLKHDRLLVFVGLFLSFVGSVHAQTIARPGNRFALSEERTSTGTYDRNTLVARVVSLRQGGREVEYDIPNASPDDRLRNWQFPARVLEIPGQPPVLLNAAELEPKVDRWLAEAKLPRSLCGQWTFTWNAFKIECDPKSVLAIVTQFNIGPEPIRNGVLYRDPKALAPVAIQTLAVSPEKLSFIAEMELDPEAVERERVEAARVAAEIAKNPEIVTHDRQMHAGEKTSGTITTTFDIDIARNLRRRTTVTRLTVRKANGETRSDLIRDVVEWRLLVQRAL